MKCSKCNNEQLDVRIYETYYGTLLSSETWSKQYLNYIQRTTRESVAIAGKLQTPICHKCIVEWRCSRAFRHLAFLMFFTSPLWLAAIARMLGGPEAAQSLLKYLPELSGPYSVRIVLTVIGICFVVGGIGYMYWVADWLVDSFFSPRDRIEELSDRGMGDKLALQMCFDQLKQSGYTRMYTRLAYSQLRPVRCDKEGDSRGQFTNDEIVVVAKRQKAIIWLILALPVVLVLYVICNEQVWGGLIPDSLAVGVLPPAWIVIAIVCVYHLAKVLKLDYPWVWCVGMIIPLVNLILLLLLNGKAKTAIRSKGVTVGLMGANKAQLENLAAT